MRAWTLRISYIYLFHPRRTFRSLDVFTSDMAKTLPNWVAVRTVLGTSHQPPGSRGLGDCLSLHTLSRFRSQGVRWSDIHSRCPSTKGEHLSRGVSKLGGSPKGLLVKERRPEIRVRTSCVARRAHEETASGNMLISSSEGFEDAPAGEVIFKTWAKRKRTRKG